MSPKHLISQQVTVALETQFYFSLLNKMSILISEIPFMGIAISVVQKLELFKSLKLEDQKADVSKKFHEYLIDRTRHENISKFLGSV